MDGHKLFFHSRHEDCQAATVVVLTAVPDARLERAARERGGAALDDARLEAHLQHVGLGRCTCG